MSRCIVHTCCALFCAHAHASVCHLFSMPPFSVVLHVLESSSRRPAHAEPTVLDLLRRAERVDGLGQHVLMRAMHGHACALLGQCRATGHGAGE